MIQKITRLIVISLLLSIAVAGCTSRMTTMVMPHPDAPLLIVDTFGPWIKVAVYDKDNNEMIEVSGWLKISDYKGRTLHKYNWDKVIQENSK